MSQDNEFFDRVGREEVHPRGCEGTKLIGMIVECPVHGRTTLYYDRPLNTNCPHDPEPSPNIQVNTAITADK